MSGERTWTIDKGMQWPLSKQPSSWLRVRLCQPPNQISHQVRRLRGLPILVLRSSQQALKGRSSHLWLRMMSQFGILSSSLHLKLVEAIPNARGRIGTGSCPAALDAQGTKSQIHRAGGSVLLPTEGTQRQALRSGAPHGITMHGDPTTSISLPLTLGKFQPEEEIT